MHVSEERDLAPAVDAPDALDLCFGCDLFAFAA
jgi:hypothetical protein